MNNEEQIQSSFMPIFGDLPRSDDFPHQKPLLAHYTSIEVFEKILHLNELWFSNPLLMNDWQEVRWGILEGVRLALVNEEIAEACGSHARHKTFNDSLDEYLNRFQHDHALNTYVFCLCEHEKEDYDGTLLMWRGYGNQAGGLAVVLDSSKFGGNTNTHLVLSKVIYASDEHREIWLHNKFKEFASIMRKQNPEKEFLYVAAHVLFERLKLFSIFSKHSGFKEEREWRAAYLPWMDEANSFQKYYAYNVTSSGVHPKLKLPVKDIPLETGEVCSLEKIVERIILGLTVSSPLARAGLMRMLDCLSRPDLKQKVYASGIPFRRA